MSNDNFENEQINGSEDIQNQSNDDANSGNTEPNGGGYGESTGMNNDSSIDDMGAGESEFNWTPPSFEGPVYDGQNNDNDPYIESGSQEEEILTSQKTLEEENKVAQPTGSAEYIPYSEPQYRQTQFEQQPPMKKGSTVVIIGVVGLLVIAAIVLIFTTGTMIYSYIQSDKVVEESAKESLEEEQHSVKDNAAGGLDENPDVEESDLGDVQVDNYEILEPVYDYIYYLKYNELKKYLAANQVDLDYYDDETYSPLYYAAMYSDAEIIDILIENGATVDLADDSAGYASPLYIALYYSNLEAVEALIEHGADVNIVDEMGITPIMYAAYSGTEFVQVLLDEGADPTAVDVYNWSGLAFAAYAGNKETYDMFLELGADETAVDTDGLNIAQIALSSSNVDLVIELVGRGYALDAPVKNQDSMLHMVTDSAMAEYVMDNYECDFAATNEYGETPLHIAAYYYFDKDVIQKYLDQGADVNAQDFDGITPLMYSVGDTSLVELLLDNGADKTLQDDDGYIAYDYISNPDDPSSIYVKRLLKVE